MGVRSPYRRATSIYRSVVLQYALQSHHATREALIVEARGELFRFYYDLEAPEVLHITLRHGATPRDAIRAFF